MKATDEPLIGHESRWNALVRAFSKGALPQTLLIAGPPHVGKSTLVWRYARLLLCPNVAPDENGVAAPCGACRVCHQVEIETFPDFRVYRPLISQTEKTRAPEALDSSIISVEVARDFGDEALRKPTTGARKVLVIQQFDRVSEGAQNALLKTLEEPPSGTFLVLTTENVRRLRETILSRCWLLPLSPAPDAHIASWLQARFPDAQPAQVQSAVASSLGRPGLAFRAVERALESGANGPSRADVARDFIARLDRFSPVGALRLAEEAQKVALAWWDEDAGDEADSKKLGAKGQRAAMAHFLDELALAGRAVWLENVANAEKRAQGAARLDLIRKTRHHILRNAGISLALDVLFGRLIALRSETGTRRG